MIRSLILAALATSTLFLPRAEAHNVWLLPSSTILSKAETVTVDAAVSNDLFFFNHVPLALENLTVLGPDGNTVPIHGAHKGKLRSVFDLDLKQSGTYQLAVLNQGVMAHYKLGGEQKRWRGKPEALAKAIPADATELKVTQYYSRIETFITLGSPSATRLSGEGMELKPISHPNDLVSKEASRFVLHLDGKPLPNVEVSVIRGGVRYRDQVEEILVRTDDKGEFSVTWPQAGMYWLEASFTDNKITIPAAGERRASYVLTLEVMPR